MARPSDTRPWLLKTGPIEPNPLGERLEVERQIKKAKKLAELTKRYNRLAWQAENANTKTGKKRVFKP